jgi:hypothetical protein
MTAAVKGLARPQSPSNVGCARDGKWADQDADLTAQALPKAAELPGESSPKGFCSPADCLIVEG